MLTPRSSAKEATSRTLYTSSLSTSSIKKIPPFHETNEQTYLILFPETTDSFIPNQETRDSQEPQAEERSNEKQVEKHDFSYAQYTAVCLTSSLHP